MNDLLATTIEMRRGTTYTFRVSGGNDPESNAEYHPMYLTDSPTGGYVQLTAAERAAETVYAGIVITATDSEGGVLNFTSPYQAPICVYKTTDTSANSSDGGYQEYFDSLDLSCRDNATITQAAAVFNFTPNASTPDELFYQCVTHRNLGWRIRVLNAGDPPLTFMPSAAPVSASVVAEASGAAARLGRWSAPRLLSMLSAVFVVVVNVE